MLYIAYCLDKPDHAAVRAANRPAHVEFLKQHAAQIVIAGPVLSEDGQQMVGSLFILEFDGRGDVDRFLKSDPYAKAGLFASVDVRPWRKTIERDPR
ncbi:MAG TPA: YciI family protein [Hypericibacter adhaerens]|jgi:uncharacterized protein YciI|uniref:YciI family protein n=1 Tax=Hypericibacter adhaerens TaxID=2602016 RepID=UPI002CC304A4|nr:YciI family protein [Hypericibacter adhaerens]HWA42779.1 YciI family protein [Hypericibacter adhaerens]